MSEVKRMVRMPEEESKNPLTRLAEEIKKKTKKKNDCTMIFHLHNTEAICDD